MTEENTTEEAAPAGPTTPVYTIPTKSFSPVKAPTEADDSLFPLKESLKLLPEAIQAHFGDALLGTSIHRGELTVLVTNEAFHDVCAWLRDTSDWDFNFCSDVTGVDYLLAGAEPRFENVVHLYSIPKRHRVRVKCHVDADDLKVASVTDLWPTANYHERETYDMYGFEYEGHPNLCRILMADDWEGFPLRKDFPLGGVKSYYYKQDTEPRAGEPENFLPRIREQLSDI